MIDLHLHTTASDGVYDPPEVVRLAWEAGLRTIAVADHDTMAGVADAMQAAAARSMRVLPAIEITAVHNERDVHVLAYGVDPSDAALIAFLSQQRAQRIDRAREIGDRLAALGKPIDIEALLQQVGDRPDASIGRPVIARALIEAGHVADIPTAFNTLIGEGAPAFVPRQGGSPAEVVARIAASGAVASLAHPGLLRQDDLIAPLLDHGLAAIEVYHSDHTPDSTAKYLALARDLQLCVTGGSDFHGDPRQPRTALGVVTLPAEHLLALEAAIEHTATRRQAR